MSKLFETSIAIQLRDSASALDALTTALAAAPTMSIVTRIELEGGAAGADEKSQRRERALRRLLSEFIVLEFDTICADQYRAIVRQIGFSRRQILDRMIAATAIVHGLVLVTSNGPDFADIPGLDVEVWPAG